MLGFVLKQLREDCTSHGYGRKKWWATQLGIPPLTLSHWLAGRQRPNGIHAFLIKEILDQKERDKRLEGWRNFLWDSYYSGQPIPAKILPMIISEVLSLSTPDSRTLALLSRYVEKESPKFEIPSSNKLRNRLGWLLEISGKKAPFPRDTSARSQVLLKIPGTSQSLKKYLQRYQTSTGRKWRLYDCSLDELKKSLP